MFLAHQMLLQFPSLQKPPPLITTSFLLKRTTITSSLQFDDNGKNTKKRRANSSLSAMEKESHFELDPDKAREALAELDQQLQSLSQKQVTPSKDRVSSSNLVPEPNDARDLFREEMPELSGSFLAYSAFALFMFTIFYNIIFITVIKPSVDGGG
ncbi:uncharacterized protein LOC122064480 [Macadamia integrifolia]|uniref:uncharacterized protein LOC122064480 n=1 Tax=Macadamia integrifolia TaxID=60698 RepID=UPI001C4E6A5E|nr:uncharacterized protein LOC122064480 [Macadamia integrifolia]